MDITDITDLQTLKAMAYDQMALLEQVQHNLSVIQTRINELQTAAIIPAQPTSSTGEAGSSK